MMLKADRLIVRQGDIVLIEAPSGGGYGNPLDRTVEAVRTDVLDGFVSIESARRDYGVVIHAGSYNVDGMATATLRARMRPLYKARSTELAGINRQPYFLDEEAAI
jgi:N-methylhydantoinase B